MARPPELLLLLYNDRSDPVSSILLDHHRRFPCEVLPISAPQLVSEVIVGTCWEWRGRTIDPERTAVVHRLGSLDGIGGEAHAGPQFQQHRLWAWLRRALARFAYTSAVPTPASVLGSYGSLLDQWMDLPELVRGLRVPLYRAPGDRSLLPGEIRLVDPRSLYSLGRREDEVPEAQRAGLVAFTRPGGQLVHAAQVGGAIFFANEPPDLAPEHMNAMMDFAAAMASLSSSRIMEHAFFVGHEPPVLYSTCPVPVITGRLEPYVDLLVAGLTDDIVRYAERLAA